MKLPHISIPSNKKHLGLAGLILLVLVGGAVYWFVIRDTAPKAKSGPDIGVNLTREQIIAQAGQMSNNTPEKRAERAQSVTIDDLKKRLNNLDKSSDDYSNKFTAVLAVCSVKRDLSCADTFISIAQSDKNPRLEAAGYLVKSSIYADLSDPSNFTKAKQQAEAIAKDNNFSLPAAVN